MRLMAHEIEVGGRHIAYQRCGDGPPIVLLHGILSDSRLWHWQLDGLADEFTVVAWDAPGCGRSSDPPDRWRMPDYADCLVEFLQALGLAPPHLLGLSWGGTLALEVCRRHPGTAASLVFASTYAGWAGSLTPEACAERLRTCLLQADMPARRFVSSWLPGLLTDAAPAALAAEVEAIMSDFHPAGYRAMARAVAAADLREVLPAIEQPTLLLWGELDRRAPTAIADELHDAIPSSRLIVMRGVGHLSNAEAPEAFNAHVRRFLRTLTG